MVTERDATRLMGLVVFLTFVASWLFGPTLALGLGVGMGFSAGYLVMSDHEPLGRSWNGLSGAVLGFLCSFIGILGFVVTVKVIWMATGVYLRDVSFIEHSPEW